MPDINPIVEGTNALANGLEQARKAGKKLTQTIEHIQHDGIEVAQQELDAKLKDKEKKEAIENSLIYQALKEYEKQSAIIKAEQKAEKEFKAKYGADEWAKVLQLKQLKEKQQRDNNKYYGHKLDDVKRVQFYCWFFAFIITCLLFYFGIV